MSFVIAGLIDLLIDSWMLYLSILFLDQDSKSIHIYYYRTVEYKIKRQNL